MFFFFVFLTRKNPRQSLKSANCAFGKLRTWLTNDGCDTMKGRDLQEPFGGFWMNKWVTKNKDPIPRKFFFRTYSDMVVVWRNFPELARVFFLVGRVATSLQEKSSGALDIPNYFQLSNFPSFGSNLKQFTENFGKNTTESPASSRILPPKRHHKKKNIYLQWFSIFVFTSPENGCFQK